MRRARPVPSRTMHLWAMTGQLGRKCDEFGSGLAICSTIAYSLLGEEGNFMPQDLVSLLASAR